jgi:transcriptional regulator with PAS, ATPase and Fis domain
LLEAKGNKSKASKTLEISRTSLYEKMDKYKIKDS